MDPSKPLPHEFEEGKLSRYNDNVRQKYMTIKADVIEEQNSDNEHETNIVSQYSHTNDSFILNKTEFREILMNALNSNAKVLSNSKTSSKYVREQNKINSNVVKQNEQDAHQFDNIEIPEIEISHPGITPTGHIIYPNQTIEQSMQAKTPLSTDVKKKLNSISLDAPEVDKLLNGGM